MESIVESWDRVVQLLQRLGEGSTTNEITAFTDGDALFERFWERIESAERRVWVETYILGDDRVGRRTLEALERAAKRGCHVALIIDAVGSLSAPADAIERLREAGACVLVFNPVLDGLFRWRPRRRSRLQRNHRKIAVIDDNIAFVGGMNISEDYAGAKYGRGTFVDCHLEVNGPAVIDLAGIISGLLRECGQTVPPHEWHRRNGGGDFVQVLESTGWTGKRQIQRAMRLAVRGSRRSVDIATPYFVPPPRLLRRLVAAARRGRRVRLLVAGRSDVPVVTVAARHVYRRLLSEGVRIYELDVTVLHAKLAIFDGVYAMVGSFNLDHWSDARNLEVKVGVVSPTAIVELAQWYDRLVESAREITLDRHDRRRWLHRVLGWLAYQVLRI